MKKSSLFAVYQKDDHICGRFSAMASPCEILFDTSDKNSVYDLMALAYAETKRIEQKFSRYINGNCVGLINASKGKAVTIDEETFQLFNFANTCYEISDGMFDITSGILRKVWRFDGSDNVPSRAQVNALLPYIGWHNVVLDEKSVCLPAGFEIDFGGIGKEYAVNKVTQLLALTLPNTSILVNFGGDIQVSQARKNKAFWQIGIENPSGDEHSAIVNIAQGGLATSGDANRYLLKDTKRYSHILNPKTGYPVEDAPRSITVASQQCVQAGLLATLALLKGKQAERFLKQQDVLFWCYR